MNYTVKFVKSICIYDAESIINNFEQGWKPEGVDDHHPDIVSVSRVVEIKFENDVRLMKYIKSLQELSKYDIIVMAAKSRLATYTLNKNEHRWEKKFGGTVQWFNFVTNQWINI